MTQQWRDSARPAESLVHRRRAERARRLFAQARDERFAVLAFNAENQDTVVAIARAAAAKRAPVLVAVDHEEAAAIDVVRYARTTGAMVEGQPDDHGGVATFDDAMDYAIVERIASAITVTVRLMPPVIAAVQRAAEDHTELFGAAGRVAA